MLLQDLGLAATDTGSAGELVAQRGESVQSCNRLVSYAPFRIAMTKLTTHIVCWLVRDSGKGE